MCMCYGKTSHPTGMHISKNNCYVKALLCERPQGVVEGNMAEQLVKIQQPFDHLHRSCCMSHRC